MRTQLVVREPNGTERKTTGRGIHTMKWTEVVLRDVDASFDLIGGTGPNVHYDRGRSFARHDASFPSPEDPGTQTIGRTSRARARRVTHRPSPIPHPVLALVLHGPRRGQCDSAAKVVLHNVQGQVDAGA